MSGDYPTDKDLETIRKWPANDPKGLLQFVKGIWKYADLGFYVEKEPRYYLSTGGWSGNEEIVGALQENKLFWFFCWYSSRRGGHYVFEIPKGFSLNDGNENEK